MRVAAALFMLTVAASPAAAQRIPPLRSRTEPPVAPRVFLLASAQQFAAGDTFETVFGSAVHPFFGGGISLAFKNKLFVDGTVSFFRKSGERAFSFDGEDFQLGIPLRARIIPIELTAGYRLVRGSGPRLTPYIGGGVGAYSYKEESDFDEGDEKITLNHVGYLAVAGAEYRITGRMSAAFDIQYSHVPGILGDAGLSQELGDDDLGGIAIRFRLLVGN